MKKRILLSCLIMSLCLFTLTACSSKTSTDTNQEAGSKKLSVYTSFYAMYDFAKKIGGDRIELINLVPSGTEPHEWEPSTKDIVSLEKADVFIYNGAGMESWTEKILSSLENKKLKCIETSKGLKLLDNTDNDEDLKYDPHVWLNPMLAKQQMEAIKNIFVEADPKNKDFYLTNYENNAIKLDELNKEYKDAVSKFTKKDIVVAHQAFGYICNAFGLNQVAIEGLNADSEPSPSKMAEISDFAKKNNVKYIFFEELISPKVAQAIAKEVGAQTAVLNPLEGLEDEDIKAGKEYISVMKDNLEILKKALM